MQKLRFLIAALMCGAMYSAVAQTGTAAPPPQRTAAQAARWLAAQRVTILRDTRGIPHVYGKSDADAVFGLMYAQAEDDFGRIERNYINALGPMAEVEGKPRCTRTCA